MRDSRPTKTGSTMPLADCRRARFEGASLRMPHGAAAGGVEANVSAPPVWVLIGNSRGGDYNQLLALAEALALPYEIKHLTYNRLARFAFLRDRLLHLTTAARETLRPPWPDLVIGLGYQSMP